MSGSLARSEARFVAAGVVLLVLTAALSLFVGVSRITPADLWRGDDDAMRVLLVSRVPRLLATILAGSALAVAGLIMQGLTRNRFVAPSTAGTIEAAGLGSLVAIMWFGSQAVIGRMAIAVVFALAATAVFLVILHRLRFRDALVVPLVGIMFGGVIRAIATYVAFKNDLLQTLNTMSAGNFAVVLRGRYELLWSVGAITVVAYLVANRITVAGMGRDMAINLGVRYERVLLLGLALAASATAVVVVVVGELPFLGLVVPNVATAALGDNVRRVLPATAIGGALFVLVCDILGRTIRAPYEIPVGTIAGVLGGLLFVLIAIRSRSSAHYAA